MIKNILFDLDDTILDFKRCEKEALILSLKEFDIDPSEEIISTYSSINESEWKKFERGETTTAILKVERYKRLLEHFKIDKDYHLLSLAYEKNLSKFYYFIEGAKEMLTRESFDLPKITLKKFTSIYDFEYTDFELEGYKSGEKINFEVAI